MDEAIEHMVLRGCKQAQAARDADCCPMALSRGINKLKESGHWDDHVLDIAKHAAESGRQQEKKRELEMPTPGSLGKQIKASSTRLGDGWAYGGKGNMWGEYREGHKIATIDTLQRMGAAMQIDGVYERRPELARTARHLATTSSRGSDDHHG